MCAIHVTRGETTEAMVGSGQVKLLVRSNALLLREFTVAQMRRVTGAKPTSVRTELHRMKREGLLTSEPLRQRGTGRGAPPHVYRLTDDPEKRLELVRSVEAFYRVEDAAGHMEPVSLNYKATLSLLDQLERIDTDSESLSPVLARARRHAELAHEDIAGEEGVRGDVWETYLKVAQARLAQASHAWQQAGDLLKDAKASYESAGLAEMVHEVEAEMAALHIIRGLAEAPDRLAVETFLSSLSCLPRYLPSRVLRHVRRALVTAAESEAVSPISVAAVGTAHSLARAGSEEDALQSQPENQRSLESSSAHALLSAPRDNAWLPSARREPYLGAARLQTTEQIRVIAVGGGGGNALNRMIKEHLKGVEFIAVNTDAQGLFFSEACHQIRIGDKVTRGLGAGGDPEIGARAARESEEELRKAVADAEIVFITAGIGGGTGTGACPLIGRLAKEAGALTIGVVTQPFGFEGNRRKDVAEKGIEELKEQVDTLILIPNDRLLRLMDKRATIQEAFGLADELVLQAIQGISGLITVPGLINLSFADVRAIMSEGGLAFVAVGRASGDVRAADAAHAAAASPLLDLALDEATGIVLNVTGGTELALEDLDEAIRVIRELAHPDLRLVFGVIADPAMSDEIEITIIATGFHLERLRQRGGQMTGSTTRPAQRARGDAAQFLGRAPRRLP